LIDICDEEWAKDGLKLYIILSSGKLLERSLYYKLHWENGDESVILWGRWINLLKNKHWFGIRTEAEGAEGRNLEKGLFLRKLENAAKHETRLRGWWATGSDVND